MANFYLSLTTQEKNIYDGEVTSIILPGSEGYFGVLAYHAPLISVLKEGKVTLTRDNKTTEFNISGGFFEIKDNKAIILAEKTDPEDLTIYF